MPEDLSDSPQSAPIADYPRKLFYRIQEAARIAGVKPHVLRYWETEFKELSPEKDRNDQRRYRQADIDLILMIRALLYEQKYTIAGARLKISEESPSAPSSSKRRRVSAANLLAPEPAAPPSPTRSAALKGIRSDLCDLLKRLGA